MSVGGLSYMRGGLSRPPELSDPTVWAATLASWRWPHERLWSSILLNPRAWEAPRMAC